MTKVRADQLDKALAKGLSPIYIVSGDEPLLVQEACDTIRAAARAAGFCERELYHNEPGFDWGQVLSSANSLSLFAERKLIELRLGNGKPGDKGAKALLEYAAAPAPDTLLLLAAPKLDGSTQRSKWFKGLEQAGCFVQIWPVTAQQLPRWIGQRLRRAGLKADSQAQEVLASRVEGNLLAASQEIEKLKLLVEADGFVTAEMMSTVVADSARYDVFGLVDKALHGDARGAVKNLHGLRGEGTDATVVLWALAREIRTLSQVAYACEQGQNFDWAAKNAGVWDKRKPLIKTALRRLKSPLLQVLLRKANAIDKAIKGMHNADPWGELLDLTLNLAGTVSLHPRVQKLALTRAYS
ncbi:DNA polymerase III subunit delta [Exilibacterium tricleocarpae]|uniref:DNA polymerase III subunit delta n=1 Tax=Exilibacterium tricleocarpae TaxID=2591008 RepID=A0A545STG4_9GAMM|nr:DNA polymerase III subunit delta [Exilibacterium tricleocarpae]TQV68248.1 DNA polymerase III subunit delta [Exilibacterium tricleocarpae]